MNYIVLYFIVLLSLHEFNYLYVIKPPMEELYVCMELVSIKKTK